MKRSTLFRLIRIGVKILTQTRFVDAHNVPPMGGPDAAILLATNHMSRLDIPLLMMIPGRTDVICLAADKYKEYPVFKYIIESSGSIWLDRDKADFTAMRTAIERLRQGVALGIAPEGTRSDIGALLEGKPGTALLASKAGIPIVPIGIAGTEVGTAMIKSLRRPPITIRFGPAFTLPPVDRSDREGWLKQSTDEIMCRIAALLPEKYHGFYAGHPRLRELLQ
jgi:1-acyl-sn-glycerol-3-phosphate acyltransferase